MNKQLINLQSRCNTKQKHIRKNIIASSKYPSVSWGATRYSPCAVVGGGPSTKGYLDTLRNWDGDIYGINDTAGYLSQNGIGSYMYAIDSSPIPFKSGLLVKGAVFATKVNPIQFIFKNARTFEMLEDSKGTGIGGGPSAAARAPHLFLRMGYSAVVFFGIDTSFHDVTHISGNQDVALQNMIIVRVDGIDYLTNGALYLQAEWLVPEMQKHPELLINASDGLFKAMIESPNGWEIVAVEERMKKNYDKEGYKVWNKKYVPQENKIWQSQKI